MEPIGRNFEYGCLRSLALEDTPGMLEWMHDESIADVFNAHFLSYTAEDVRSFIEGSWNQSASLHFAIQNSEGSYLGTVSLKSIDEDNLSAEYAISTRKASQGTGSARRATMDVLSYAFEVLGLERVYLDVKESNYRAIGFYEKVGFVKEGEARKALRERNGHFVNLLWYSMLREEFKDLRK